MLGFRWILDPAGAPDQDDYINGVDQLRTFDQAPLQDFHKPDPATASPSPALQAAIDQWLTKRQALDTRIVVMVHGFNYSVKAGAAALDDPYNRVYAQPHKEIGASATPESWLPIVGETDEQGKLLEDCAVAFGWESMAALFSGKACLGDGFQYAALDVAPLAAKALATMLLGFRDRSVTISMLAHSLGTRTAIQALRRLADSGATHLVDRVVLLEGSEFSVDAYDAMTRLPNTDFINVGNQDDWLPPFGGNVCHPFRYHGTVAQHVVGHDGVDALANLADLQIDRGAFQTWATAQSYTVDPGPIPTDDGKGSREAHWAGFIHAGNRRFLHDLLRRPDRSVARCRDTAAPFGFEHLNYGGLAGIAIPAMPGQCLVRRDCISHGKMPDEGVA